MIGSVKTLEYFWERLRAAGSGTLMLDYDGTLAPFVEHGRQATPYPGVESRLERLALSPKTRLVMVTGRRIEDLLELLPLAENLEVWGSHGLERRNAEGEFETPDIDNWSADRLRKAREASLVLGLSDYLEEKPGCMAQHWRGIGDPHLAQVTAELLPVWSRLAGEGLQLREFDGGVELRSSLANKSRAVESVKRAAGKHAVIAYLGDDQTDEDAFCALGSNDLSVLVRPEYRPTRAQVWLRPPGELLGFLDSWLNAICLTEEDECV